MMCMEIYSTVDNGRLVLNLLIKVGGVSIARHFLNRWLPVKELDGWWLDVSWKELKS